MFFKVIFNAVAVLQIYITLISAYKYGIAFRDETIFSPCDFENVTFLDDYVDLSNLKFEQLMNGSVHFHGYCVVLRDFMTTDNDVLVQLFKKSRGNWVNTIYNMRRGDFCKTLFDPLEYWDAFTDEIPPEDKICPFSKGKTYHFDSLTDVIITVPDAMAAGEYKGQITVRLTGLDEVFCANVFGEVYRQ